MIRMVFENSKGRLNMGHGQDMRIISVSGLGLLPKVRNVVSYAASVGQSVLSETVGARTITVKADFRSKGDSKRRREQIISILNEAGELKLFTPNKNRKIECICTGCEMDFDTGIYSQVIMQFTADYPYFTDFDYTDIAVFTRSPSLSSPFSLPCVFSIRNAYADITVLGDVNIEPVFTITASAASEYEDGFKIENAATGQKLEIIHSLEQGETVDVDIKNRKITSSVSGDITAAISDDTFLSDFHLVPGVNTVSIVNNTGGEISAVCTYSNQYIEGVF